MNAIPVLKRWSFALTCACTFIIAATISAQGTDLRNVVRGADGSIRPAPGYVWDGDPQTNDFAVRLQPHLLIYSIRPNGLPLFIPEAGYVWDGDPQTNNFAVKLQPHLLIYSIRPNGLPLFIPDAGYVWDGDPQTNNFAVKLQTGLVIASDGNFSLAPGFAWVDPSDESDLRVELKADLRGPLPAPCLYPWAPCPGER